MSTVSMVTTLGEMDLTLGDDTKIVNQICILAATQGDGIPLCPTSFQGEDATKLCIGLSQEHPEDVLWLLDTETVLIFQCDSEMIATT